MRVDKARHIIMARLWEAATPAAHELARELAHAPHGWPALEPMLEAVGRLRAETEDDPVMPHVGRGRPPAGWREALEEVARALPSDLVMRIGVECGRPTSGELLARAVRAEQLAAPARLDGIRRRHARELSMMRERHARELEAAERRQAAELEAAEDRARAQQPDELALARAIDERMAQARWAMRELAAAARLARAECEVCGRRECAEDCARRVGRERSRATMRLDKGGADGAG